MFEKLRAERPLRCNIRWMAWCRYVLLPIISLTSLTLVVSSATIADEAYLKFGKVFPAEKPAGFDPTNPHHVAQYSVYLCKQGESQTLSKLLPQVESDPDLGRAFRAFINEICPDLERFKDTPINLKFTAYYSGNPRKQRPTTVWYYYLKDKEGAYILHKSWVSVHRSTRTKRCALTGIFLNPPGEKPVFIPRNTRRR